MGSGPLSFKETDLVRAIKSALKAGLHVVGFEISPKTGNILVHASKADSLTTSSGASDWDKALSSDG